jgi:hypothetical protein
VVGHDVLARASTAAYEMAGQERAVEMRRMTHPAMRTSRLAGIISLASLSLSTCEQSAAVASASDVTFASTDVVIVETGDNDRADCGHSANRR